jgi:uroporphyrinogen-III synthase
VSVSDLDVDLILLASPSAVEGLLNQVRVEADTRLLSIGPTTSTAIRAAGLEVFAEAEERSLAGMLASLQARRTGLALPSSPTSTPLPTEPE